jgi:hypothetical protein
MLGHRTLSDDVVTGGGGRVVASGVTAVIPVNTSLDVWSAILSSPPNQKRYTIIGQAWNVHHGLVQMWQGFTDIGGGIIGVPSMGFQTDSDLGKIVATVSAGVLYDCYFVWMVLAF